MYVTTPTITQLFITMPLPRFLTLHRTAYPKIVFAGGDLFGFESLSRFDGFLAFAERGAFGWYTRDVIKKGKIQCPYRVYFQSFSPEEITRLVHEDLTYLVEKGCRRIGIHAPSFIPESQVALQATVDWLGTHAGDVDKLFFVDADDDYYHCFGLDSFRRGRGVHNPSPTEFESYYEHWFTPDLEEAFGPGIMYGGIRGYVINKEDVLEKTHRSALPVEFSIGFFYTILVPQVVAKATGRMQDTYDFLKVSKMPMIDRFMGGFMDPCHILSDTGLLPKGEEETALWLHLAKEETEYFFRVLIHYIIGGIKTPATRPAQRLYRLNGQQIKAMRQEMKKYLKQFEDFLKGGPAPDVYYLPDEIRTQQVDYR